ncbi:hypothetical protein BWI15_01185 [Kribbella sp. ALI-6-A]|uniref:SMP-30/gluconolactonase/LRE family protein n=1 Tax=Kribbella sp. ALI-6-A TaxID=1933817 RepID=UPI00097CB3C3|nr:SMP-30/gluconolactonase/LRE family protein [Kribbella sp. ALI-6-A]ONI78513.1 hypothetical protein BWI15_01185 [Kribbella sp. ALI-6-A]
MRTLLEGLTWGEGPRYGNDHLVVSDPHRNTLWSDASGRWVPHALPSASNGLGFLPDGSLIAALMDEVAVGKWNGTLFEPYCDLSKVASGPLGDLTVDAAGGLYVDDVGYAAHRGEPPRPGRLIYVSPGGRDAVVAADNVEFPNGICLVDNGRTLIVAETWRQRLLSFHIVCPGVLTDRRDYAVLGAAVPAVRPDGICPANGGGVWVATLTGRSVLRVDRQGVKEILFTGSECPIAVCVGADGSLFATLADTSGLPLMEALALDKVSTKFVQLPHTGN